MKVFENSFGQRVLILEAEVLLPWAWRRAGPVIVLKVLGARSLQTGEAVASWRFVANQKNGETLPVCSPF